MRNNKLAQPNGGSSSPAIVIRISKTCGISFLAVTASASILILYALYHQWPHNYTMSFERIEQVQNIRVDTIPHLKYKDISEEVENNREENLVSTTDRPQTLSTPFDYAQEAKDIKQYLEYNSKFVLSPPHFCESPDQFPFIIIVVPSKVDHFDQRHIVRQTWGNINITRDFPVKVVFLLGLSTSNTTMTSVAEEFAKHGDLIQADFLDAYRNLTLKSMLMLKWALQECRLAEFILKADEDVYVNLWQLTSTVKDLQNSNKSILIAGRRNFFNSVIRRTHSKWYVSPEQYGNNTYPWYVTGSSYLVNTTLLPELFEACLNYSSLPIEDAVIAGIGPSALGTSPTYMDKFLVSKKTVKCPSDVITWSNADWKEILSIHEDMMKCYGTNQTETSTTVEVSTKNLMRMILGA